MLLTSFILTCLLLICLLLSCLCFTCLYLTSLLLTCFFTRLFLPYLFVTLFFNSLVYHSLVFYSVVCYSLVSNWVVCTILVCTSLVYYSRVYYPVVDTCFCCCSLFCLRWHWCRSMAQVTPDVDTSFPRWSTILETKLNDGGRHRRPSRWGKDARANIAGDLTAGNWRLHRRLSGWGVATTLETKQLGIGDVAET